MRHHESFNEIRFYKKRKISSRSARRSDARRGLVLRIYAPLEARIRAADTTDLEDEISLEQIKAQKLQAMQAEIDENKAAGLPELQTYNYFKNEVEELNQIFSTATDFNFSFSEPVVDGNTVRRDVSGEFWCEEL